MKQYKIGYTQGVFDMFHIGHLNLLNNAKKLCDYLIVGVNTDRLVKEYKKKTPVINERDRAEIVKNIKSVDSVVLADTLDKEEIYKKIPFTAVFVGDDWKGSERWNETEVLLAEKGIDVVFLPHTDGISSSSLRIVGDNRIKE